MRDTYIDLYIRSPFEPTTWFCSLVFTKSSGNTTETPMMPAMPPFMIFGRSLESVRKHSMNAKEPMLHYTKKKKKKKKKTTFFFK